MHLFYFRGDNSSYLPSASLLSRSMKAASQDDIRLVIQCHYCLVLNVLSLFLQMV